MSSKNDKGPKFVITNPNERPVMTCDERWVGICENDIIYIKQEIDNL